MLQVHNIDEVQRCVSDVPCGTVYVEHVLKVVVAERMMRLELRVMHFLDCSRIVHQVVVPWMKMLSTRSKNRVSFLLFKAA